MPLNRLINQVTSYEVLNGHILLRVPCGGDGDKEHRLVLDTGSPVSFPYNIFGISREQLSAYVGTEVDGLLGMDFLETKRIDVTMPVEGERGGLIAIHEDPSQSPLEADYIFPVDMSSFVPTVRASLVGDKRDDFLLAVDTGAPVGYLSPEIHKLCPERKFVGMKKDFFPLFGSFETSVHDTELCVEGLQMRLPMGVLPQELSSVLTIWGVDGIIGWEFLSTFKRVVFDFPNEEILAYDYKE